MAQVERPAGPEPEAIEPEAQPLFRARVPEALAAAPAEPQLYDMVLMAVGRRPNGREIDADKAGVIVNERGFIPVDKQQRTNVPHIFAIGDICGDPMLAHKIGRAHV